MIILPGTHFQKTSLKAGENILTKLTLGTNKQIDSGDSLSVILGLSRDPGQ